jgi:signal transduction histidine kinase
LRDLCRIFSQRAPLHIVYNGTELPADIREGIQLSFYRFLQEALTNVVRHAEASAVNVNLEYEDHVLSLRVSDNGVGFDHVKVEQEGLGLGLLGMKERFAQLSGELTIDSKAGEGATLCASVAV